MCTGVSSQSKTNIGANSSLLPLVILFVLRLIEIFVILIYTVYSVFGIIAGNLTKIIWLNGLTFKRPIAHLLHLRIKGSSKNVILGV